MHVLLTNDDGPPSDTYSPYFHYLVQAIHKYTDWHVTVVLPDTQRSWIGKAHMIGQTITATYIEAPETIGDEVKGPYKRIPKDVDPKNVWTLLNGTPATCTNIGLNYMIDETKGPVDLVISGPNFGRNTTALYSTTSGTIGAAMEGALCGSKGIALSYAYYSRDLVPEVVTEASRLAVKLISKLYNNWDKGVDLYSINVPLIEGLSDDTKAFHAPILQNRWKGTFEPWEKAVDHDQSEADGNIPIEPDSEPLSDAQKAAEGYTMFRWAPDFEAVGKSVKASSPGNDGWVVDQGHISVTGLKASFSETGITGEISLNNDAVASATSTHGFLLTIPSTAYLHPLFSQSVKKHLPNVPVGSEGSEKTFHYGEYEDLDFDKLGSRDKSYFGCSYIYRKALIRKHYLANTIAMFRAKNPGSILNQSFPDTFNLELDYAEFLDESLDEAYELRQELEKNDEIENASDRKLWILKPSMSDKAQGIRLFSTIDELQEIFDSFEEGYDSDDEDGEQQEDDDNNGIITSQLRHFIVQEYVDKPLILSGHGNKKFHIRTYVLAVGDINVYVYKHMLALFAPREYATTDEVHDLSRHLTNTCLRDDDTILKESLVEEFWNLKGLEQEQKDAVFSKICENVKDLFLAATTVDKINFQPLANSMEFFGLDFLVDEDLNVHILEVNSYPDFKQTGDDLKYVVEGLVDETVQVAVKPWFEGGEAPESDLLKRVL